MTSAKSPTWSIWVEATRPRTLPAAIAPVVVGSAMAARLEQFNLGAATLCLMFAVVIQIGTNFANDYYDFQKGADNAARVGPRRAVAAGLVRPEVMRNAMLLTFATAFIIGLGLLPYGGWPLLVIGIASILCGIAYTGGPYPLAYHGLGDVFVFLFFGLIAVVSTFWVQTGKLMLPLLVPAAAIGALATNILVVNNYRDIDTDKAAGKRTLLVRRGKTYGQNQFALAHIIATIAPAAMVFFDMANSWAASILVGLSVWVARRQARQLRRAITPGACIALLGSTGKWLGAYGVMLAIAIAIK